MRSLYILTRTCIFLSTIGLMFGVVNIVHATETENEFLSRDTAEDVASDVAVETGAAYMKIGANEAKRIIDQAGPQSILGERGKKYASIAVKGAGKIARFGPLVLDGLQEAGETGVALAERDNPEAFAQFVGGTANVGLSFLGGLATDAAAIACASLGAWRGGWRGGARAFGQCTAIGAGYSSVIANAAESQIEKITRAIAKAVTRSKTKRPGIISNGLSVGGGRRTKLTVHLDGSQTTIAMSGSNASSEVGVGRTGGVEVDAKTKGVTTLAARGGNAYSGVGVGTNSGDDIDVKVQGAILTQSTGGDATLRVGAGSGDSTVDVRGPIITTSRGSNTSTIIGGRTTVKGFIYNTNSKLFIGDGACKAVRKGRCCIAIHRRLCVWHIAPRTKYGCPPRYRPYGGACDLYSDFQHQIDR